MRYGYDNVGVACNAVIMENRKLLLVRRAKEPHNGLWHFPGGHVEKNETAEEAVIREIREELGVEFRPKFAFYHDSINPDLGSHHIQLIFTGEISGEIKLNYENSEFKWFTPEEAAKLLLAFKHNKILDRIKNRMGP